MKADAIKLLDFMSKSRERQFVIPVHQRLYSWGKKQCKKLWDDIIKIGENDRMDGYFIGPIVFVQDSVYTTNHNEFLIIDG